MISEKHLDDIFKTFYVRIWDIVFCVISYW